MSKRFVIALIKHETNTFSPIATPLSAFGQGNGPYYGEDARVAFAGSNTPFAAFLDIARREGAAAVTPIAAHIVECAGADVTDLSAYRYRKLARPIYPPHPFSGDSP